MRVEVYFFDPTSFIGIQHPEFTRADLSSEDKGKIIQAGIQSLR
ncbi:MAG TPA: hypothetical protein VFL36_05065 [Myxococcales bacterium]|nr:hypothetical protein [Myxococcales bacterium]